MESILYRNELALETNRMRHTSGAGEQTASRLGSGARAIVGLAVFTLPLAGCATGVDVTDDADTVAAIAPEWHYLGPIELSAAPGGDDSAPVLLADEPDPRRPRDPRLAQLTGGDDGRFGVMFVDFERRAELVASYDEGAIAETAAELARLGHNHASKGDPRDTIAVPKGWSHDIDNRISFEDYALTHSTLRRIGRVGGGCSGALFGNRLVLTAAHCIFDGNGNYVANTSFAPRRNGSELPFGTVTSQGAYYPIAYKDDGCNITYTGACVKNDWAVLILPPNPWQNSPNGAPGYFGFAWAGDSSVASWATRNVGYPSCGSSMAPVSCVSNVAYGDLTCANVSPRLSSPDNRWPLYGTNGKMDTGCDTSGGHSGGPIYSYDPGENGPYIIGNTVWNQCNSSSCGPTTLYSSAGIRISETLFDWMLSLRSTYP